ncbi:BH3 interacting domain death agonist isoform X2 [Limanda limanda]|uniref:BH3 interacting domain death agonist isoform X2 n=1 Tax=Limanda limanda TaxID=27771 RepID=UPI0029C66662|nr:BH3 interacting domain death agonist isoform X2 [Limanda limanda]
MDNRVMDVPGGSSAALVMLAFLQADCRGAEIQKELHSLGNELHVTHRDINCNGPRVDPSEDGDLETDGHLEYESVHMDLQGIQPVVELPWQWNQDPAANIQQVAGELREIADQLEESVMTQATRNLMRNTSDSRAEWRTHLNSEVQRIIRNGTGLEHLPQERVFMALTLTLVKGVCEQAPQLLRSLFNAALQFIGPARVR